MSFEFYCDTPRIRSETVITGSWHHKHQNFFKEYK